MVRGEVEGYCITDEVCLGPVEDVSNPIELLDFRVEIRVLQPPGLAVLSSRSSSSSSSERRYSRDDPVITKL